MYLCPGQTRCTLIQSIDTCFVCSVDGENSILTTSDVLKKQKDDFPLSPKLASTSTQPDPKTKVLSPMLG